MKMRIVSLILYFAFTPRNNAEGFVEISFEMSLENATSQIILPSQNLESGESAEELVRSLHTKVGDLCRHLHNKSKAKESVYTRGTKIHVACVLPTNQAGSKSRWSINFDQSGETNDTHEIKLSSESWRPCDDAEMEIKKTGSKNLGSRTCYAVIQYLFLNSTLSDGDGELSPILEALLVTDRDRRGVTASHRKDVQQTDELGTNSSSEVSDFLRVLGNSSTRCEQWNDTAAVENTSDARICRLISTPIDNADIVTCTCAGVGYYRVIYLDQPINDHLRSKWNGARSGGVSFWLNYTDKEKMPKVKADFESFLLSQLFTQLGYENSSLLETAKLSLVPTKNKSITVAELTFRNTSKITKSQGEAVEFVSSLDKALATGSLILTDRRNRSNLAIPIQRLQLLSSLVPPENNNGGGGTDRKDSIFLWFIFGVVLLMTVTLIIIGVRNHLRAAADSVQPISFQSVEGLGMSHRPRRTSSGDGGDIQGNVASARSMTTIMSESSESGQDEVRKVIGAGMVGIGTPTLGSKENPIQERPPPSAFQVKVASDILVTEEDGMDRIHYLPPPRDDNNTLESP